MVESRASATGTATRRRYARAALPITARLFQAGRSLGHGIIEDISIGGMRVVIGQAVSPGRFVTILADLPAARPFQIIAQVTRRLTRRPGEHVLGLTFVDLPAPEQKRVEQLCAQALRGSAPSVEFFDTQDGGRCKRMVLAEGRPLVDPNAV